MGTTKCNGVVLARPQGFSQCSRQRTLGGATHLAFGHASRRGSSPHMYLPAGSDAFDGSRLAARIVSAVEGGTQRQRLTLDPRGEACVACLTEFLLSAGLGSRRTQHGCSAPLHGLITQAPHDGSSQRAHRSALGKDSSSCLLGHVGRTLPEEGERCMTWVGAGSGRPRSSAPERREPPNQNRRLARLRARSRSPHRRSPRPHHPHHRRHPDPR